MKKLLFVSCLLVLAGCSMNQKFPEKMPADFKIEYHLDGGMLNTSRTIILQNGECSDKGREDGGADYDYRISITNPQELEILYTDLKKLGVFGIKGKNKGEVMDRGGESILFTINGKIYDVNNSQSNFISKKDGPAFDKAVSIILKFAEDHREPAVTKGSENMENDSIKNEVVDSISTGLDQQPIQSSNQANLGTKNESLSSDANTVLPPKMPNDFKIQYEMSGGISGAYRKILLQYGSSTDEGKNAGESKYSNSFTNMALKDYEALYNDLYKLDAFILKYTTNNKVADRGGEMLIFTLNGREYKVSDKDQDYIKSSDKAAFKKSVALVLNYVDSHKK